MIHLFTKDADTAGHISAFATHSTGLKVKGDGIEWDFLIFKAWKLFQSRMGNRSCKTPKEDSTETDLGQWPLAESPWPLMVVVGPCPWPFLWPSPLEKTFKDQVCGHPLTVWVLL